MFAARGLSPIMGFFVGWLYVGFSIFLPPFLFILNGWFIDTTMKTQGWWTGSPGWWFWGGLTALVVFCLWVLVFLALINSNVASATAAVNNCSRVLFAMGRSGSLPAVFGRTHPVHRTPHVAVIFSVVASMIVSVLASNKFGASIAFGVVGTTFTVLAIIVYMISCAACIGFFATEGRAHQRVLLHVVVPLLGIVVFAFPLYAQYFDLNQLFSYVLAYPFNWGGIAAVVWVAAGVVVTGVMAMTHGSALEAATRGFSGGVADEVV